MLAHVLLTLAALQSPSALPEILSYNIQLTVEPAEHTIEGRVTLLVAARGGKLSELRLSLNRNLELDSVRDGQRRLKLTPGASIGEGRELLLRLVPALAKGKRRLITIEYHGSGADPGPTELDGPGLLLVRENELRLTSESQWYPVVPVDGGALNTLRASTTLELSLPAGMHSFGPGKLVSVTARKTREVHRWESDQPVRASLAAGRLEEQIVEVGKQRVRVLSNAEHMAGAMRWAQAAAHAIEVLGTFYGDIGPRTFGMLGMNIRQDASSFRYEADGFSMFDATLFGGHAPDEQRLAHDVAHLFFGGALDARGHGERFLSESMAEAAALVFLEHGEGKRAARDAAQLLADRYFESPGDELPVAQTGHGSPRQDEVILGKGTLALRTLRSWGDPAEFDSSLGTYFEECRAGRVLPTLAGLLGELRTGLGPLVDTWERDWLLRTGTPLYSVEYSTEPAQGNLVRVKANLVQTGPVYHNPVELRLISKTGRSITIRVMPMDRSMIFQAVAPHDVARIEIDPLRRLLTQPGEVRCLDED